MSFTTDIADALVAAGLGIQQTNEAADWMMRIGYMQASPDRSVCVYTAGGQAPETGMPAGYPNFQIKVRGNKDDYAAVEAMETAIYRFLHAGNAPVQFGATWVYCYAIQSAPLPLGQDENRRPALCRNYRTMVVRT